MNLKSTSDNKTPKINQYFLILKHPKQVERFLKIMKTSFEVKINNNLFTSLYICLRQLERKKNLIL